MRTLAFDFADADFNSDIVAYPDSIMSAGSLLLIDHNLSSLSAIPAGGGTVPNIAWEAAKAILGSGAESTLAGLITKGFTLSNEIIMEVTGKKGMHGISSQVSQTTSAGNYFIAVPTLIRDYIYNNPTHKYFVSWWGYVTRKALLATAPFIDGVNTATPTSNRFFMGNQATTTKPAGNNARDAVSAAGGIQDIGAFIRNATHDVFTGTLPASTANLRYQAALWGPRNSDSSTTNKGASWIHYRTYIEDLTVSGRSYATVDALDLSMWTAASGVGGRLYNDTFTAPATLP